MTFLYSCFLQKFGLYFFDAEPVGTLNETSTSVYLPNTIKLGKSSPVHIYSLPPREILSRNAKKQVSPKK